MCRRPNQFQHSHGTSLIIHSQLRAQCHHLQHTPPWKGKNDTNTDTIMHVNTSGIELVQSIIDEQIESLTMKLSIM